MTPSGKVLSVRLHVGDGLMRDEAELRAVAGSGFEEDVKAGTEGRHALLADSGTMAACGMKPGDLQEQITVEFPGLQALAPRTELLIGGARLTITEQCEPCKLFARRRGAGDPRAFIREMRDKRGVLACVLAGGVIRPGDPVFVAPPSAGT